MSRTRVNEKRHVENESSDPIPAKLWLLDLPGIDTRRVVKIPSGSSTLLALTSQCCA
jgi:hypothetical protein